MIVFRARACHRCVAGKRSSGVVRRLMNSIIVWYSSTRRDTDRKDLCFALVTVPKIA